jgi:hypothetical protein
MYTNSAAAFGTGPSRLFTFNKFSYSPLSYVVEIFNHAHTVFGSISFVQVLHTVARKLVALKTIFRFTIFKGGTVLYSAFGTSNRLIDINRSATGAFIFLPEICHAYTAVHTAWGD